MARYASNAYLKTYGGPWYPRSADDLEGKLLVAAQAGQNVMQLLDLAGGRVRGYTGIATRVQTRDGFIWLCGLTFERHKTGWHLPWGTGRVAIFIPSFTGPDGHPLHESERAIAVYSTGLTLESYGDVVRELIHAVDQELARITPKD
ncbi:MAG TPA: hypothetical protein VMS08_01910 [Candidatus Saccharimonadia bacterium]|nr:hypothetical protein [Candidatus Saccharimonadia bacterium]